MSDTKLLPCPVCGKAPRMAINRAGGMHIFCDGDVTVEIESADESANEDTLAAWNTRALTPRQAAADEMFDALSAAIKVISAFEHSTGSGGGPLLPTLRNALDKAGRPAMPAKQQLQADASWTATHRSELDKAVKS